MKKKLANLLFMVTVALQATAQITILSMDDVKKSEWQKNTVKHMRKIPRMRIDGTEGCRDCKAHP